MAPFPQARWFRRTQFLAQFPAAARRLPLTHTLPQSHPAAQLLSHSAAHIPCLPPLQAHRQASALLAYRRLNTLSHQTVPQYHQDPTRVLCQPPQQLRRRYGHPQVDTKPHLTTQLPYQGLLDQLRVHTAHRRASRLSRQAPELILCLRIPRPCRAALLCLR